MSEPPDEYDPEVWGPWPKGGVMVSKQDGKTTFFPIAAMYLSTWLFFANCLLVIFRSGYLSKSFGKLEQKS